MTRKRTHSNLHHPTPPGSLTGPCRCGAQRMRAPRWISADVGKPIGSRWTGCRCGTPLHPAPPHAHVVGRNVTVGYFGLVRPSVTEHPQGCGAVERRGVRRRAVRCGAVERIGADVGKPIGSRRSAVRCGGARLGAVEWSGVRRRTHVGGVRRGAPRRGGVEWSGVRCAGARWRAVERCAQGCGGVGRSGVGHPCAPTFRAPAV